MDDSNGRQADIIKYLEIRCAKCYEGHGRAEQSHSCERIRRRPSVDVR